MQILSSIKWGGNVHGALEKAAAELNVSLSKNPGRITKLDANIESGISGATARIVVTVDENDIHTKYILWANEPGGNEGIALRRAQDKINTHLTKIRGELAGFYLKFITPPLPKRTYATVIVAVNEDLPQRMGKLSSEGRKERLAALLRLLGNDPKSINLAHVARVFGVSRDTIYKDLEDLNTKR